MIVLSANDPTQSKKDIPRYEKLFERVVGAVNMSDMGHTVLLFNSEHYVELLERALARTEGAYKYTTQRISRLTTTCTRPRFAPQSMGGQSKRGFCLGIGFSLTAPPCEL